MRKVALSALKRLKRLIWFSYFRLIFFIYKALFFSVRNFDEKYLIEATRRKQWFYRSKFDVFNQKHYIGSVGQVDSEDLYIASQIHKYWSRLELKAIQGQTIWDLKNQGADELFALLEGSDTRALALDLKNMFHSTFIQGISHGFRHKEFPSSKMLVPVVAEDRLISLAEYLGVVPAETCEQGLCGIAMRDGLEDVVARIECLLGISINFPENLGASGISIGGRVITLRQIEHIYGACRLKEVIENSGVDISNHSLVEIGGGYGGFCLWTKKILHNKLSKYYIVDLPWVLSFQAYFLKKVLGEDKVAFWNDDLEKRSNADVILCSAFEYQNFFKEIPPIKVFVNQDSLPEMSNDIAMDYLEWIFSSKGALFFSYQQENGTRVNGTSQNCIGTMISSINNAKLLTRNLSWTRSGYTEEAYIVI